MAGVSCREGDREFLRCIDPRTGQAVAEVDCTPISEVTAAVQAAREAQVLWADQGLKRRKWAVADLHQSFLAHAQEIADLLAEECGRPAGEAWTAEVVANHALFGWWLDNIDDLLTATPLALSPLDYPKKRGQVRRVPVGVVGLITPWNLPVAIPLRCIIPSVLAGNAVVFKPSEHSPRTGALIARLCDQHLPSGVVRLVQGGGAQGAALVDASPDMIVFTGSVRTGKAIAQKAAESLMPVALELGGKDAALVLPDADLDRTAAGLVWGAFAFGGQNCAAVERVYVHEEQHDALVEKLVERTRALRALDDVGPLITPAQLAIVQAQVADAVAAGATIAIGGQAEGPGYFHQPTVLTDVVESMGVAREETFGPVLPVLRYTDVDAAIERINDSPYGLTTSVWTRDLDLAEAMAPQFECGVVTINNHSFTGAVPDAAWGGPKDTGHGVTNSRYMLYELTRPRTVLVDAMTQPREMWWFPYNAALVDVASGLVELSRKGGARLQGIRTAIGGLLNRWKDPR